MFYERAVRIKGILLGHQKLLHKDDRFALLGRAVFQNEIVAFDRVEECFYKYAGKVNAEITRFSAVERVQLARIDDKHVAFAELMTFS